MIMYQQDARLIAAKIPASACKCYFFPAPYLKVPSNAGHDNNLFSIQAARFDEGEGSTQCRPYQTALIKFASDSSRSDPKQLPVFRGRVIVHFTESPGKITLIRKTKFDADLLNGTISGA
jgi:hypothetical protein